MAPKFLAATRSVDSAISDLMERVDAAITKAGAVGESTIVEFLKWRLDEEVAALEGGTAGETGDDESSD